MSKCIAVVEEEEKCTMVERITLNETGTIYKSHVNMKVWKKESNDHEIVTTTEVATTNEMVTGWSQTLRSLHALSLSCQKKDGLCAHPSFGMTQTF